MSMAFNIVKNKLKDIPMIKVNSVSLKQVKKSGIFKEFAKKLGTLFLKEIGFNEMLELKNKTELPTIGKSKVLYVLPDKTSLSWHRQSKEYKKFDIDKAMKKLFNKND